MHASLALVVGLVAAAAPALGASARAHHAVLARRAQACSCPQTAPAPAAGKVFDQQGTSLKAVTAHNPKKRRVPKVKPSKSSLTTGAQSGLGGFVSSGAIPASVAHQLGQALNQSIASNTHTTTAPAGAVSNGQNAVYPTSSNGENMTAVLDIQKSIDDALNAAVLAETNLNASTQAALKSCLTTILANGGLPANYSCITNTGSTSAGLQQTLNNVLEQFLGILPNKILQDVFDAVSPQLTTLLPDERTLVSNIMSSIKSITASASGGSVTALEQLANCYSTAVTANGNVSTAACYTSSGAYATMQASMNGVLEQFVGVLPPNLIQSVQNLVAAKLGTTNNASQATVYQQLNNAIMSVGASLSGSSVTLFENLEQCAQKLLINGDAAAAKNCTTSASVQNAASTVVNSIAQQFAGYLPSSFFTDLVNQASSYLKSTSNTDAQKQAVLAALQASFDNSHLGPSYVGCFEQVQSCVVAAVTSSGNANATCPGPVKGCERIGLAGNGGLASTSSAPSAASSTASPASSSTPASSSSPASSSTQGRFRL